jgi:hypothetical protein
MACDGERRAFVLLLLQQKSGQFGSETDVTPGAATPDLRKGTGGHQPAQNQLWDRTSRLSICGNSV